MWRSWMILKYFSRKRNNLTMDPRRSSGSECVYGFSTLRKQTRTHSVNGDSNWCDGCGGARSRKSNNSTRSRAGKWRSVSFSYSPSITNFHSSERANQARIKRLTEAFTVFDQEANNTIPSTELGTVVRSLGLVPTEGELQDILSEVRQFDDHREEISVFRCRMIRIPNRFI